MTASAPLVRARDLGRGARGLVTAVAGGPGMVARLAAHARVPGTTFEVLRDGTPMAIALGSSRLALGASWADALVVRPR